jgi:hypothetical protein
MAAFCGGCSVPLRFLTVYGRKVFSSKVFLFTAQEIMFCLFVQPVHLPIYQFIC